MGPLATPISWMGTLPTPVNTERAPAISRVIFFLRAYPLYISIDERMGMFSDIIQPML